jgi:tyrosyl-tRNA synthetase
MSKSLGNYIGITEPAREIFGKVMSVSDALMFRYYELVSAVSLSELETIKKDIASGTLHPMEAKKRLAAELVDRFCTGEISARLAATEPQDRAEFRISVGQIARQEFEKVFSKKNLPADMPIAEIAWEGERMKLAKVIALVGAAKSNSDARRLIQQGAVEVNEVSVRDIDAELPVSGEYILRVGKKRFVKVVPKK